MNVRKTCLNSARNHVYGQEGSLGFQKEKQPKERRCSNCLSGQARICGFVIPLLPRKANNVICRCPLLR
ncbi:hypothetical protein MLD38_018249 [Melastoma candidum]|uniref:Uncharacterized protein n=1 Tax=Melastoma candidum TaxID=119954 RepID=A0ACB9QUB9_9MYRT|nr:hypothetical protein MLD38_018249 [Melastoma candidum]